LKSSAGGAREKCFLHTNAEFARLKYQLGLKFSAGVLVSGAKKKAVLIESPFWSL
jgi:hypothetical protein